MKMKNRKGSTLVMTLMVFVVLMIFGTVTLNLMANENKQSRNHQYKIQAYYIARSGAEAVESVLESVIKDMNEEDLKGLYNDIKDDETEVEVNGEIATVKVRKEKDEDNKMYFYTIISRGQSGNVEEKVEKVMSIKVEEINEIIENKVEDIKIDRAVTYIEDAHDLFKGTTKKEKYHDGQQGTIDEYPTYNFKKIDSIKDYTTLSNLDKSNITINAGNYVIRNNLKLDNKNIEIIGGEANIYVEDYVSLKNTNITCNGSNKLNIYIYGINKTDDGLTLELGEKNNKNKLQVNFFVQKGKIKLRYLKLDFNGSIVSNGNEDIDLHSHSQGNDNMNINGLIYAPNATINFGYREELSAIIIEGAIVGNILNYNGKENHGGYSKTKVYIPTNSKVEVPDGLGTIFEEKVTIKITKSPGYFK